jgi:hypothetical protein
MLRAMPRAPFQVLVLPWRQRGGIKVAVFHPPGPRVKRHVYL